MTSTPESADVIVIGMGPAGESVAGQLAEAGLDVVGIDRELVGGECPYWGCVPSKMMIRAAHLLAEARRIPGVAGKVDVVPDWSLVAERIRAEATDDWDDTVAVERFEGKGGRFVRGEGRLVAPGVIAVGDRTFRATRGIVIATGTRAAVPPIPGLAETPYWTNREAIETEQLPESIIVLGGGAIGVELAQVFARFGVQVAIVEALGRLVPLEEPEAGEVVAEVFEAEGIAVHTGTAAMRVEHRNESFVVTLDDGTVLDADRLLVATGRRTDLAGVGVAASGSTRRPGHSTSTRISGSPTVCGPSATSPGRAPSPTWACTRPISPSPTSSGTITSRRAMQPSRVSPSPTPRWVPQA